MKLSEMRQIAERAKALNNDPADAPENWEVYRAGDILRLIEIAEAARQVCRVFARDHSRAMERLRTASLEFDP